MTDVEFSALLDDRTKRIAGDILWLPDERVRTPFLYPDGDNIDLFVQIKEGISIVSDLGETLRWLRSQTLAPRRTPKQNALVADACVTHGVELFKGMLVARCKPGDSVATVIMRVAQACLRISDLWLTFRTRAVESVNDEVADFLAERQLPFERRPKLVGRSGRGWTVDFHVMAPAGLDHRSDHIGSAQVAARVRRLQSSPGEADFSPPFPESRLKSANPCVRPESRARSGNPRGLNERMTNADPRPDRHDDRS